MMENTLERAEEIPAETYVAATGASILAAIALYLSGWKQAATFVGLWAPTIINLGLFLRLAAKR